MKQVMNEAIAFGYQVLPFVLDPERSGTQGIFANTIRRFPVAALPATQLDARRFAHLNASIIHGYTSIAA